LLQKQEKGSRQTPEKRATKNDADDTDDATERARKAPPILPAEGYTTLEWHECGALLRVHKNHAFELETFILVKGESATAAFGGFKSGKDGADRIAGLVWKISGYRFMCVNFVCTESQFC
jgi:hypothetical protein